MKVFISWSGDISHQVANVLRDWLPSVIQSLKPYVSSEDIAKGTRWSTDISKELENSSFGILCVTKDNRYAPWLNFEAGALSRSVEESRVSPFLFGVDLSEIKDSPLLQFQATTFDKADVRKLVHSLNDAGDTLLLDKGRLDGAFDRWWPDLETRLKEIKVSEPEAKEGASSSQGQAAGTSIERVEKLVEKIEAERKKEREYIAQLVEKLTAEVASKNPDEAAETAESVRRDPAASPMDRAIAAAVRLQQQGETEKAIEKWRSIANVVGEEDRQLQARAWFSVGHLHSEGPDVDFEAAIDAYTRAIELKLDYVAPYNNRGIARARLGQHRAALADFDQAIWLKPAEAPAYCNRGIVKRDLGQHRAALADYDQAIRLKPDYAEAYSNRGNVKRDLGQHRAALADYDQAIRLKPAEALSYYNRGIVQGDLGQAQAALADYDQAIRLKPDLTEAYADRGATKRDLGQYRAALADYDQAIRLKPDDAATYYNRGVVKEALGRINEAREDYQKALALAQESGDEELIAGAERNLSRLGNDEAP